MKFSAERQICKMEQNIDMKIGTILFTYQRSIHTKQVLDGLSENDILPDTLYIFQDGKKSTTNTDEWEKVQALIKSVDWCKTEVHIAEKNRGLARAIVSGIEYVLNSCDAVIVLEDDCVPHRHFMRYMTEALCFYKNEKRVYAINGNAWDIDLEQGDYDAYFNGRASSWGWGTWKNRWSKYTEDYKMVAAIKDNPETYQWLQIWGPDLEGMVVGNVTGRNDSWAVFWALVIIQNMGYCVNPYKSLVSNIGFDGTGTHKVRWKRKNDDVMQEYKTKFRFPYVKEVPSKESFGLSNGDDNVTPFSDIDKECREEFKSLYSAKYGIEKIMLYQKILLRWITMKQKKKAFNIDILKPGKVAVWGKGAIFDAFVAETIGLLDVECIIESMPSVEVYQGFSVIDISELPDAVKNIIVIPTYDMCGIIRKVRKFNTDICVVGIDDLIGND